jgi:hypothetical protein
MVFETIELAVLPMFGLVLCGIVHLSKVRSATKGNKSAAQVMK